MPLHAGEIPLTLDQVRTLLARDAAPLSGQRLRQLPDAGTTSHVVRVGDVHVARFPREPGDAADPAATLRTEQARMREARAVLPVPAPAPVLIGSPGAGYPLPWSLQTWVPGTPATEDARTGSAPCAEDLASLILAMRAAPTRGRTFTGGGRGGELAAHDPWVQECLDRSTGLLPVAELRKLWARLRDLPREDPDALCHGDLIPANLLLEGERLVGVLDTGGFGPADPALDLVVGWHLLDRAARARFREALDEDELRWARGAAWAFEQAIGLVWYYETSHPAMAALGRSTLARLLADSPAI